MSRISTKEVMELQSRTRHVDWHEGLGHEKVDWLKKGPYPKRYWPSAKSYIVFGLYNEIYVVTKDFWDKKSAPSPQLEKE